MGQLRIPSEVLPAVIRAEIVGLERDFVYLSEAARARAIRANLSDEAWAYIDGAVAERLQSLDPDVLADASGA